MATPLAVRRAEGLTVGFTAIKDDFIVAQARRVGCLSSSEGK